MSWKLVDKQLLEKISSAGISRVTGISEAWIQNYINKKYEDVPNRTEDVFKKSCLIPQCDEIWSFVGSKKNKVWIWLAMDGDSRKIAGSYAGRRDAEGALVLWDSFPESCRKTLCFILISGQHIKKFSLKADISPSKRTAERQVI